MMRQIKERIGEALHLFWYDVKNLWLAIVIILAYLAFQRKFLYSSCPMVLFTGYPCPGCGLTRAGMALLRGDFSRAWQIHPFIYPIVILFILFVLNRYMIRKKWKWMMPALICLMAGMILFYIYRMCTQFPGTPPMSYFPNNLMQHIVKILKR